MLALAKEGGESSHSALEKAKERAGNKIEVQSGKSQVNAFALNLSTWCLASLSSPYSFPNIHQAPQQQPYSSLLLPYNINIFLLPFQYIN